MFRTTLRSASGPLRSHHHHACLSVPKRHAGGSRCYTTPANENEQDDLSNSLASIKQISTGTLNSTDNASSPSSTPVNDNPSIKDTDSAKEPRENEPATTTGKKKKGVKITKYSISKVNIKKFTARDENVSAPGQDLSSLSDNIERQLSPMRNALAKLKAPKTTAQQKAKHKKKRIPVRARGLNQSADVDIAATHTGSIKSDQLDFKALDYKTPPVPGLSFGLDRVLFNPGVYHLRDPRSRVYNFDPHIGNIMPVTEFDFNALKAYITSSKDETLTQLARDQKKKYIGSSSSMTGVLSHFHYLLSRWREPNYAMVSREFEVTERNFTKLLRSPSAMFLHYKDGVYAIDADKEYDTANILMNLGKSMEKQLTLPKEAYERYSRTNPNKITAEEENAIPESYHYSTLGDFLMRSQLDAYDPRLPGTGMFDLKTRAVISIRLNVSSYERGLGYEIRDRFGLYESYEREYHDMIRAAFLKYSLQVRVGRMDGIFVAFHNTERIFGFQYIPLSEMDYALHGQTDPSLGDREFQLSIKLWNEILDKFTARYPKQSLRLHFETTSAPGKKPLGSTKGTNMMIYAQPVTDEEIRAVQENNKAEVDRIQQELLYPETLPKNKSDDTTNTEATTEQDEQKESFDSMINTEVDRLVQGTESGAAVIDDGPTTDGLANDINDNTSDNTTTTTPENNNINNPFLNKDILQLEERLKSTNTELRNIGRQYSSIRQTAVRRSTYSNLMAIELKIQNTVRGRSVTRPRGIHHPNDWEIDYRLIEYEPGNDIINRQYESMRKRRRTSLKFKKRKEDSSALFKLLKKLSRRGKIFREKEDEIDKEHGVVVYKEIPASVSVAPAAAAIESKTESTTESSS